MARVTSTVTLTSGAFTQVAAAADTYALQNVGTQDVRLVFKTAPAPATGTKGMILKPLDIVNSDLLGQGDVWAEPIRSGDGLMAKIIG